MAERKRVKNPAPRETPVQIKKRLKAESREAHALRVAVEGASESEVLVAATEPEKKTPAKKAAKKAPAKKASAKK